MKRGLILIFILLIIPVAMAQSTCKDICAEENYDSGNCKVITGGKSCLDNEVQKDLRLYCDLGKVCCCKKQDDGNLIQEMNIPLIISDSPGLELPDVILKPLEKQKEISLEKQSPNKSLSSLFKIFFKKLLILLF